MAPIPMAGSSASSCMEYCALAEAGAIARGEGGVFASCVARCLRRTGILAWLAARAEAAALIAADMVYGRIPSGDPRSLASRHGLLLRDAALASACAAAALTLLRGRHGVDGSPVYRTVFLFSRTGPSAPRRPSSRFGYAVVEYRGDAYLATVMKYATAAAAAALWRREADKVVHVASYAAADAIAATWPAGYVTVNTVLSMISGLEARWEWVGMGEEENLRIVGALGPRHRKRASELADTLLYYYKRLLLSLRG